MTIPDVRNPAAAPILERLHRLTTAVTVYRDPIERDSASSSPLHLSGPRSDVYEA